MTKPCAAITSDLIASALKRVLQKDALQTIHFCEGTLPPPPLAFMVRFPRLSVTLSGVDVMEIEKLGELHRLSVKGGQAVFVPPNCWNKPSWTKPVKVLNFLFGKNQIGLSLVKHDGKQSEPQNVDKLALYFTSQEPMVEILQALIHLSNLPRRAPTDRLLIEALLYRILDLLQNQEDKTRRKALNTYEKVCLYIQHNFNQNLSREGVAAYFHLNPNHLSRLFRQEGLMRFVDYLAWVRIDRAKHLLKKHDLTLEMIAASCGFTDTAYFCRVFKQRTNRTPSQYRRLQPVTKSELGRPIDGLSSRL